MCECSAEQSDQRFAVSGLTTHTDDVIAVAGNGSGIGDPGRDATVQRSRRWRILDDLITRERADEVYGMAK